MKRMILLLAVLAWIAAPLPAQQGYADKVLRFEISGTVIALGDPFSGDFSILAAYKGNGNLGNITGQGFYTYLQIPMDTGAMICGPSQSAIRLDSNGDMLLLQVTPGVTGALSFTGPGTFTWEQTWTGTVVGGTGRFAGATGTFKKTLTGFGVVPGFVNPWEGTLEITLDRK